MTTYTKAEREFWEKCCSAPYVVLQGEGTQFQPVTHCHEEAEMCALTADAKLEEWRKRFGTPESCDRCKWLTDGVCGRFNPGHEDICKDNNLAWFSEKETDR